MNPPCRVVMHHIPHGRLPPMGPLPTDLPPMGPLSAGALSAPHIWPAEHCTPVHTSQCSAGQMCGADRADRKSTRLNSSHVAISYHVFCLKDKNTHTTT